MTATRQTRKTPRTSRAAAGSAAEQPAPVTKTSKLDLIVGHLTQPGGASLADLVAATGWQAHSVRGALAGSLKKKGHAIVTEKGRWRAPIPDRRDAVTGAADIAREVEALEHLDLEGLRALWRERYGAPPRLRSVELLRLSLAWRLQAEALGGLDGETRRLLRRRGRVRAEGLELGIGAKLRREWQGRIVEVVVEANGFRWDGRTYVSLSAAATAIAGSRLTDHASSA